MVTFSPTRVLNIPAEAYIEGNITVIRVHVQVRVFARRVLHHEAVVVVEPACFHWEEQPNGRAGGRAGGQLGQNKHFHRCECSA